MAEYRHKPCQYGYECLFHVLPDLRYYLLPPTEPPLLLNPPPPELLLLMLPPPELMLDLLELEEDELLL